MMEVDSQETGFVLVRQGSCRNNSILKLREHNMIGEKFISKFSKIDIKKLFTNAFQDVDLTSIFR